MLYVIIFIVSHHFFTIITIQIILVNTGLSNILCYIEKKCPHCSIDVPDDGYTDHIKSCPSRPRLQYNGTLFTSLIHSLAFSYYRKCVIP